MTQVGLKEFNDAYKLDSRNFNYMAEVASMQF